MVTTLCAPFCRAQHTRRLDDRLDDVRPQRPGASNNNDDDDRSDNLFGQHFADHYDHSGYDHDDHGAINDDDRPNDDGRPNDDHSGYDHDELHDDIDHHDDEHYDDDRSEENGDCLAD